MECTQDLSKLLRSFEDPRGLIPTLSSQIIYNMEPVPSQKHRPGHNQGSCPPALYWDPSLCC